MTTDPSSPFAPPTAVAGVILAAGRGRRMGTFGDRPKLLLPLRGAPLIGHVVQSARASRLAPLCIVLGHHAEEIRAAVDLTGLTVAVNHDAAAGQSGSLIRGLDAVGARCAAVMFLLGDQPLIGPRLIDTLIDAHQRRDPAITLPVFAGRRGNPVIVAARLFPELRRLRGDTGARALLKAHEGETQRVTVDDAAVRVDVDTPEDYARLQRSATAVSEEASEADST
ncbi:MAG: nucleotidyltransferase family protein [Desulfosarcinaceae bacterium]|nr:nucleotidyltransferase family protein [Desulfosarcinaceae bacterium]